MQFSEIQTRVSKGVLRDDWSDSYGDFVNEALIEIQKRYSFACMKGKTFGSIQPGVWAETGNLVPTLSAYPSDGSPLALSGAGVGVRYFFNPGNAQALSLDGVNPITLTDENYFTATQDSYYLLYDSSLAGQAVSAAVINAGLDQVFKLPPSFKELQKRQSVDFVTDCGQLIPAEVVFEEQQRYRIWVFAGTPMIVQPPRVYFERRSKSAVLGILEPLLQQINIRVKFYQFLPALSADSDSNYFTTDHPEMVIAKAKAIAFASINDPIAVGFEQAYENELKLAIKADAYSEVAGRDLHM